MSEVEIGFAAVDKSWHAAVLNDLRNTLLDRKWSRDILLRGSLARGSGDSESDIDLVVTVAEQEFDAAIHDLSCVLPASLPGRLPPWLDGLVRDFGGIGFLYLLRVNEQKWGQIDVYLLPHGRRRRLLDQEFVLSLSPRYSPDGGDDSMVDVARSRYQQLATRDLQQALLACYVAIFLLRKRIIRRDRLQIFADTYAAAQCLRDFVVLACYPDRREHGWHGLAKVAERSPDPDLVLKTLSTFARQDVLEVAGLSDRLTGLQEIVAMLAPATWREHGEALRSLGHYLNSPHQPLSGNGQQRLSAFSDAR
jgi:hypothetical protein